MAHTIKSCRYSCYNFEDRHMAWVYGSAFYGIYFLVSFMLATLVTEGFLLVLSLPSTASTSCLRFP